MVYIQNIRQPLPCEGSRPEKPYFSFFTFLRNRLDQSEDKVYM